MRRATLVPLWLSEGGHPCVDFNLVISIVLLKMARFFALIAVIAASFVAAQSDSVCGNATLPPNSRYKANVLIIGDSISMAVPYTPGGYGVNVQKILGAKGINVEHAGGWYGGGQCSNTVKGLLCTTPTKENNYLNFTGQYDVCVGDVSARHGGLYGHLSRCFLPQHPLQLRPARPCELHDGRRVPRARRPAHVRRQPRRDLLAVRAQD